MRKNSSEFITSFISEAGTFRTNKDYFAFMELDDMACWIAADGIDSDEDMESAEIAVKSIFSDLSEKPKISKRNIKKYIMNAHKALKSESRNVRLKTSIIMVVSDYSKMVWAVAGNARLYHFRKGKFNFRSKDQSIAQMLSDAGKINEYEINEHEERNNLTNYLGKTDGCKPFISKKYRLNDGDAFILCTPGFWENVDTIEIADALSDAQEPEGLVDDLEELLLGKQSRVLNNYTVAAVYANKVFKENPKDNMKWVKKVAAVLVPILVVCAGLFVYKKVDAAKTRNLLVKSINSGDKAVVDMNYPEALKNYENAQKCFNKIKDKDKEAEVEEKHEIAQLIVEGDENFKNKEYEKANDNYLKAYGEAENVKIFDRTELEKKIDRMDIFIEIGQIEKEGDDEAVKGNYEAAIKKYNEARKMATDSVYSRDIANELKAKIDNAKAELKAKQEEDEKEKTVKANLKQAKDLEAEGDKKFKANDFEGAIKYYKLTQERLDKLTEKDSGTDIAFSERMRIEKKVEDCQKKLATPTPGTTPMPGNTPIPGEKKSSPQVKVPSPKVNISAPGALKKLIK